MVKRAAETNDCDLILTAGDMVNVPTDRSQCVSREDLKIASYNKTGLKIDETILRKGLKLHIFEFLCGGKILI